MLGKLLARLFTLFPQFGPPYSHRAGVNNRKVAPCLFTLVGPGVLYRYVDRPPYPPKSGRGLVVGGDRLKNSLRFQSFRKLQVTKMLMRYTHFPSGGQDLVQAGHNGIDLCPGDH